MKSVPRKNWKKGTTSSLLWVKEIEGFIWSLSVTRKCYVPSKGSSRIPFFGYRELPTHWGPRKVHWWHGQYVERRHTFLANALAHSRHLTKADCLEALPTFPLTLVSPVSCVTWGKQWQVPTGGSVWAEQLCPPTFTALLFFFPFFLTFF